MLKKTLFINGIEKRVVVDPEVSLASVLRNQMFLTGTKVGCSRGDCGACTVILNDKAIRSCIVKMRDVPEDSRIITIEGIGTAESLHPLQLAWIIHGSAQGGFYAPGFIMSAKAFLDENPVPAKDEILAWLKGNQTVRGFNSEESAAEAVMDAAGMIRGVVSGEEMWSKVKDKAEMKNSGRPDKDAAAKAAGAWDYAPDLGLKLPEGTLHMKLVQAKVSKGNILAVDTSEAESMPGVYKVITYRDVPGTNSINGTVSGRGGTILAEKKILKEGDAIAAVLAFKPRLAEEAAKKVKVKIEETPVNGSEKETASEGGSYSAKSAAGFAYLNEKGKLIIHSGITELQARDLAAGIGIPPEKLSIVPAPEVETGERKPDFAMEGLLGVAALVAKKPVYLYSEEV